MSSKKPTSTDVMKTAETIGAAAVCVGAAIMFVTSPDLRRKLAQAIGQADALKPNDKPKPQPSVPRTNSGAPVSGGDGVVYLLEAGPFYKIGKATDVKRRVDQLKIQLPYPVTLAHQISCNDISHVERYWHKRFAARRQNGEWFLLTAEDVTEFKSHTRM